MRARLIVLGFTVVGLVATTTAHADDVIIDLDRVTYASPGSVVLLDTRAVDAALTGATCSASYAARNNGSVHPGTDVIVSSGSSQLVLAGVEDAAGGTVSGSGSLQLGTTVSVSVRIGPDGVASMGASLSLACTPAATTSTTTTAATTTVAPTTTVATVSPTTAVGSDAVGTTVAPTTSVAGASAGPVPTPAAAPTTVRSSSLPATGADHDRMVALACSALLTGGLLCLSRRRAAPDAGR